MKNLLKEAHKLTKEIKNKYPEVDYIAQLGICISYLNNKEENEMVELKGTEKQVAWAEDIRENIVKMFDEKIELMLNGDYGEVRSELIQNKEYFRNKVKTGAEARKEYTSILEEVKEAILNKDNAKWYINYKDYSIDSFVANYFYAVKNQCTMFLERYIG